MRIALLLSLLLVLPLVWMLVMRPANLPVDTDLHLEQALPRIHGPALVAIQPWLDERHYQSAQHLSNHLQNYLQTARDNGAMPAGSIVVFPEHIGTWLVAANAPARGFLATKTDTAMTWLIARHPIRFSRALRQSNEKDQFAAAVFRMQAAQMAADYSGIFSSLAKTYAITIAAGQSFCRIRTSETAF